MPQAQKQITRETDMDGGRSSSRPSSDAFQLKMEGKEEEEE